MFRTTARRRTLGALAASAAVLGLSACGGGGAQLGADEAPAIYDPIVAEAAEALNGAGADLTLDESLADGTYVASQQNCFYQAPTYRGGEEAPDWEASAEALAPVLAEHGFSGGEETQESSEVVFLGAVDDSRGNLQYSWSPEQGVLLTIMVQVDTGDGPSCTDRLSE